MIAVEDGVASLREGAAEEACGTGFLETWRFEIENLSLEVAFEAAWPMRQTQSAFFDQKEKSRAGAKAPARPGRVRIIRGGLGTFPF
jgi:hypothetical protein